MPDIKIISDVLDESQRQKTDLSYQGFRDELREKARIALTFGTDKLQVKNALKELMAVSHNMIVKINKDLKNEL